MWLAMTRRAADCRAGVFLAAHRSSLRDAPFRAFAAYAPSLRSVRYSTAPALRTPPVASVATYQEAATSLVRCDGGEVRGLAKGVRFRYPFDMANRTLARDDLWEVAALQHGFVTAQQAGEVGVAKETLQKLVGRGTLDRAAFGVYRFPKYPVAEADPYALAVLWTRVPKAALSHETALDVYGISDVNPNEIHVTVGKNRRLRRSDGQRYVVHYEDLTPAQIGWWQEVPTVTAATAIAQCITFGTPTYLLRQALENGQAQGRITTREHLDLAARLEVRNG